MIKSSKHIGDAYRMRFEQKFECVFSLTLFKMTCMMSARKENSPRIVYLANIGHFDIVQRERSVTFCAIRRSIVLMKGDVVI